MTSRFRFTDPLAQSATKLTVILDTDNNIEAIQAQRRTDRLAHTARKKRKMNIHEPLKQYVLKQLDQLWSPEQIAKRLKILYPNDMAMQISHESIYSYLYVQPRGGITQGTSQMFTAQAYKPPCTRRQVPSKLPSYSRLYKH